MIPESGTSLGVVCREVTDSGNNKPEKLFLMKTTNLNRRAFLRGKSPRVESNAIRPPWALEPSQFIDSCERCDECIRACPEKILFRGDGGYPEVDFKRGNCTFCAKCADVCEAEAFQYFKTDEPQEICSDPDKAWNLEVSIKSNCLSLNAIVCRTCGDVCEEQAINFRLQLRGISIPEIDNDSCTGCGECLYVCPESAVSINNRI